MTKQPFEQGYQAGLRQDGPQNCPFAEGSKDWYEWQRFYARGVQIAQTLRLETGLVDGRRVMRYG